MAVEGGLEPELELGGEGLGPAGEEERERGEA